MEARIKLDIRRLIILVWVLGMAGAALLTVVSYGRTWRFDYQAQVSALMVCSGLDPVSKVPIPITQPITTNAKDISICAYLEGVGPIPLEFLWKYNGEVLAVKQRALYQPGHITNSLTAPAGGFKPGQYSVQVYLSRHELASLEFTVEHP